MKSRKEFLKNSFKMMVGAAASIIDDKIPEQLKRSNQKLFPPGAVEDYIDKCTACGECIPVCPAEAIKLFPIGKEKKVAIIDPKLKACEMCEDVSCISACEPKALVWNNDKFPIMGKAEIDHPNCLAYNDIHCTFCYDACPIKNKAIQLKAMKPVIIDSDCTGCGMCKERCVAPDNSGIIITRN